MMTATISKSPKQTSKFVRQIAKRLLQCHLPVGRVNRPLFATLYRLHVTVRMALSWSLRFFWYEPLWRGQCRRIGKGFRLEQLPYLFGRGDITIGDDVRFSGKSSFLFSSRYVKNPRLSIGHGCFLGHDCAFSIATQVRIGNHCLIAGAVRMADFDGHPLDAAARRAGDPPAPDEVRPISIGDDVWIGHGAIILKGVTIGDRAVVGARAVVTKNVPANTVVAGNPARTVKQVDPACRAGRCTTVNPARTAEGQP
jgi:acetyltransferase-like isoleucine patch superfamily enzyme